MNLCQFYALCTTQNATAGGFVSSLVQPAFIIAGIMLLFYIITAAIKWLSSGGDKQAINDARLMITHAVIGFLLLMLLFLIAKIIPEVFKFTGLNIVR